ncbi:glycosyltransferase 61 family protein [Commensalibacter sp. Nvir]|uniref:glycosyltransferase family 61 protein n=1 Tax=Commensalibacter sp. Nvir TaxID=3069817 RepID=UPI0030C84B1D
MAVQKIAVERCEGCDGSVAWMNGSTIRNKEAYPFWQWHKPAKWVYRYELQNVVLDSYRMVFFKNNQPISGCNHFINNALLNSLTLQTDPLLSYQNEAVVFSCHDHWENNYYHWMVHAIPAYYAAMHLGIAGKYLIPEPLLSWQRRSLELLGFDFTQGLPVEKKQYYVLPCVHYIELATGEADFVISQLSVHAYALIINNSERLQHTYQSYEKIYISRLHKSNRALKNEHELVSLLKQRGYFILDPEEFTLDEQIHFFQNAKIVVALLGAGLANIGFCKPDTIIYEIIPSHHENPCFLVMAKQGKLRYWADRFETGVDPKYFDHLSVWSKPLDASRVLNRLDELEPLIK